ncbi:hypothetical protein [Streptomyces sp. NPDC001089]
MSTATATRHVAGARLRARLQRTLSAITGRALVELRVTRLRWSDGGVHWVAMALVAAGRDDAARRELPLAGGGLHQELARVLRDAFPRADWGVAQDYDVTAGVLTEHVTHMPMCLRGDEL